MIVKCSSCEKDIDIGEAKRDDSFCGYCGASLRDRTEEIEHNRQELEKLDALTALAKGGSWQPKQSS